MDGESKAIATHHFEKMDINVIWTKDHNETYDVIKELVR